MPLFGMAPDEDTARVITLVALALQAILAIASTRVVAKINSVAVGLELVIVVVLAVALIVAVLITGTGSTDNLISQGIAAHAPQYFGVGGGLMLAMIMGLATLVGFDAAANLAEEAKDPFRTVPRAIVSSVAAAAVLGLVFLVTLTIAIRDIPEVSRSESPVSVIMRDQLGRGDRAHPAGRHRVRVLRGGAGGHDDLLAASSSRCPATSASRPTS